MDFTTGSFVLVGAALLVIILACYARGKDYLQFSNLINPILTSLSAVLHAVGAVVKDNSTLAIMSSVISGAIDAAGYAEKLWLDGEIDKEKRPQYAQEHIERMLSALSIDITPEIQSVIQGAIALTCYLMPHHTKVEEA